jgi:hypothetical protein
VLVISIDYSQPSVRRGRTIGKDLEPMEGKVFGVQGANEATCLK